MGDMDELHGVDHPATGHRWVSPRHRSRRRSASAAGLVLALTLGTGTLGAFPARSHAVTSVAMQTPPIVDAAQVFTPSLPLPLPSDPGVATVTGPSVAGPMVSLPSFGPQAPSVAPAPPTEEREAPFTSALPDQRAQVAIRTAMAQIGLPYVWGGDGPTNGDAGFDCSGLTTFSYAAAGVNLPRTAHTQYYTGPHVPPGAALQPGDLVFYGTPARVHHVGMYLGDGKMVNAPTFGKPVQTAFYRWNGDDYLGATRPAAIGTSTGLLPYAPPAPSTDVPKTFPAPTAPAPTTVPNATAPQPAEADSAAAAAAAAAAVTTAGAAPTTLLPTSPSTSPSTSTSPAATSSSAAAIVTATKPSTTKSSTTKPPTTTATKPSTTTRTSTSRTSATTTTSSPPPKSSTVVRPPSSSASSSVAARTTTSGAAGAQNVPQAGTTADPAASGG